MSGDKDNGIPSVDVVWIGKLPADIVESRYSYAYCRRTTRDLFRSKLNLSVWHDREQTDIIRPGELIDGLPSNCLLVVSNPEVVVAPAAFKRMAKILAQGFCAVLPVFNQTWATGQVAKGLPATYLNLNTYLEVAEVKARQEHGFVQNHFSDLDLSCVLFSSESLRECKQKYHDRSNAPIPAADFAAVLLKMFGPETGCAGYGVANNALVHTFGNYYTAPREDLVRLIPANARNILDVGCAKGGFGKMARSLGRNFHLTGVEINPLMAAEAAKWYDQIFCSPVESVSFQARFDHINCGDVIEHLVDPWRIMKDFYGLLLPGGTLVMSIPNAGHWTIVRDLADGLFPYIPLGLQCITHLRWFTESSIKAMIDETGFHLDFFERAQVPPTPVGKAFVEAICAAGYGNKESLITNEFTLRVVRK